MAIESTKRAVDKDESGQNVRAKHTAKTPSVIIVTNMKPMKLKIYWTQRKIRDFRTAKLFQFLHHSECLPSISVSLVEEYIKNYDPEDGSSVVQGRIIGIDETILEKVLFLPIGEMAVETAYVATCIHAKIGVKFKLGKFTSLLCSNYVYAVISHTLRQPPSEEENPIPVSVPLQRERNLLEQNHNAAVSCCNTTLILGGQGQSPCYSQPGHTEILRSIPITGVSRKEKVQFNDAQTRDAFSNRKVRNTIVDVIHKIGESSHTVIQEVIPVIEAGLVPSDVAMEEENEVPLLIDINQLAFPEGRLSEGVSLKNAVLKHILQIHYMVSKLTEELTVRSQSQLSIEDVSEGMSPQQHQLKLRDAQILKLET
uniref:Predicted protein n=1 Tax=Physcomitrium patens TaxID=3218 RepID=A9U346_PHYPA